MSLIEIKPSFNLDCYYEIIEVFLGLRWLALSVEFGWDKSLLGVDDKTGSWRVN